MKPHLAPIAALFVSIASSEVRAQTPPPSPQALQAGRTLTLSAPSSPAAGYKLYLPASYATEPSRLFPLVIHQNPGGRTNLEPYRAWAEQQGVILLGIDGISNGKPQGLKNQIADAVLADLVARDVRAHPRLRIVIGMSGGSADGMRLVRRKPEAYAGCVFMGAGQIIENPKAAHLAYAILGGAKDEWMDGASCENLAAKARALGCPVRVEVDIDRQHKEAPLERQTAALSWILDHQRIAMPTLGDEERAANLAAARAGMKDIGADPDPASRRTRAERCLELDPLKAFPAERNAVLAAWAGSMKALADKESSPVARNAFLSIQVLRTPWAADLAANTLSDFKRQIARLREQADVAKDWALRERYLDAEAAEKRAGLDPAKLGEVLPLWQGLAGDATGTEWEPKVARRIRIVTQFIEDPSTIQKPTRLKD